MSSALQPILFGIACCYFLVIAFSYRFDRSRNADVFSAAKLVAYFAFLELAVMLWFAIRPGSLFTVVLAEVTGRYVRDIYIIGAYAMSVVTYIAVFIGVMWGSMPRHRILLRAEELIIRVRAIQAHDTLRNGLIIYGAGVLLYLWVIYGSGGYVAIWSNLYLVEVATAPYGTQKALYTVLITFGMAMLYRHLRLRRKHGLLAVLLIGGAFCLASLGQRGPVGIAMLVLVLVHHYTIKPFKRVFSGKVAILSLIGVVFMYLGVQVRSGNIQLVGGESYVETELREFELHVVQRLGVIERQVVAIGYLAEYEPWGFGLYKSLVYAWQPRYKYPSKPPTDTGVYVKALSLGEVFTPPVPANDMPDTSWPDRFLAGYLSFGVLGLLAVAVLSGALYGGFYRLVLARPGNSAAVYLYGVIGFLGVTPLSPLGIVKVIVTLMPVVFLGWLCSFLPGGQHRSPPRLDGTVTLRRG